MTGWEGFAFSFLNARVAAQYWPKIVEGLGLTVVLAALVVVAGLALGLLLAVLRAFGLRVLNWAIIFTVDLFRALPPLVLIVLIYFGLPAAGIGFSGFWATWLALTLVLMAFAEEIFWAGICAVPKGQWEAGRAVGLRFLPTMRLVVLPQAVRIAIPPLTNRTIAITKGTALGSVVAVAEILGAAQSAMAFSGNPTPLMLGAVAYLALFLPVVVAGRWVETRFAWRR
ncbi:amino acid ABC transporter permease [Falsiroseomonas sp. CW058]|uniref:amino acid ABC transporter permease n=1 Tax=Falsiroseomonas sp. CW058 TaxID=3388664 RepID=UPI003D317513